MSYINKFLNYKCAGDVINIIPPQKKYTKEISESMGIIERIKPETLAHKMEYIVIDLCAGNALTSVLSVFTLPVKRAFAVDKKKRKGQYEKVQRFQYIEYDIYSSGFDIWLRTIIQNEKIILIGVHACGELSTRIIDIYNSFDQIEILCLTPCCIVNQEKLEQILIDKCGKDFAWCHQLKNKVVGNATLYQDKKILSPRNYIIYAKK